MKTFVTNSWLFLHFSLILIIHLIIFIFSQGYESFDLLLEGFKERMRKKKKSHQNNSQNVEVGV